jgi:hypothetical protein
MRYFTRSTRARAPCLVVELPGFGEKFSRGQCLQMTQSGRPGSGFQAASGHTQGAISLKSSTRWLSSGDPDQSNVHLDTSDRPRCRRPRSSTLRRSRQVNRSAEQRLPAGNDKPLARISAPPLRFSLAMQRPSGLVGGEYMAASCSEYLELQNIWDYAAMFATRRVIRNTSASGT